MMNNPFRTGVLALVAIRAFALIVLPAGAGAHAALRPATPPIGPCDPSSCVSTITFSSTRDNLALIPQLAGEIYLIDPDGTNPRRLTDNAFGDGFSSLSPDGKKIVFDSNRLTAGTTCDGITYNNISDLFLMDTDGSEQTLVTRGSSATWSPDSKNIAFHASASYYASGGLDSGCPIRTDPGSATSDSDIFVANVDDLLAGVEQPRNITNTSDQIEDDADWSSSPTTAPDGQSIVFTSHPVTDSANPSNRAELYVMNPDGSDRLQLTHNDYEERAAAWSPDGSRIVYSCRTGGGTTVFHICVINADGTGQVQLTNSATPDLTATWSPDGQQIVFHRIKPPSAGGPQLWLMNADGSDQTQLTFPPGINLIAHWGERRPHGANTAP
jgi:TolB protein